MIHVSLTLPQAKTKNQAAQIWRIYSVHTLQTKVTSASLQQSMHVQQELVLFLKNN